MPTAHFRALGSPEATLAEKPSLEAVQRVESIGLWPLQRQPPQATLWLTLSHMDREAVATPAQAQVQALPPLAFHYLFWFLPQGRHSGFLIWSLCPAGDIPHSSGSISISSIFPSPGLSRLTSVKRTWPSKQIIKTGVKEAQSI